MDISLPLLAGTLSTIIFAVSALPMLTKAYRTKDLASYSRGNILMANTGNVVHSVYVFHLPPGPIWLLHSFYLITTALMLCWYLRYEWHPRRVARVSIPRAVTGAVTHLPELGWPRGRRPQPRRTVLCAANTPPQYPIRGMTTPSQPRSLQVRQATPVPTLDGTKG